jgi:hypothetical protein
MHTYDNFVIYEIALILLLTVIQCTNSHQNFTRYQSIDDRVVQRAHEYRVDKYSREDGYRITHFFS